jgi:hypothetical protein
MVSMTVKASQTVTAGKTVKFDGDMTVVDAGADSDLWIGVAKDTITSGAAGSEKRVTVILPGPVVKMLVGTGDSTRGTRQKVVASGVTDAAANAGSTAEYGIGFAMQSGVASDLIGVCLCLDSRQKA